MANEMVFTGRRQLFTDFLPNFMRTKDATGPVLNETTIPDVIKAVWGNHMLNVQDIQYLMKYYQGEQDILTRTKEVRPDIDNQVVFNNAMAITRDIVGYTFGKPIRYAHRKVEGMGTVGELNEMVEAEDKFSNDQEVAMFSSICGTAYRGIFSDAYGIEDEVPFSIVTLEPENTFIVYSSEIGNAPVLACTYYEATGSTFDKKRYVYLIYTHDFTYRYEVDGCNLGELAPVNLVGKPSDNPLKAIPIVEYPNNRWRIGDWEMAKTLLDAINKVGSDCVNDLEGFVNSLLVGINIDMKDVKQEDLNASKIISFPSLKELPADLKYIAQQSDAESTENLRNYLLDQMRIIVGLPSIESGGASGGDTGDAVYLRNGFDRLETVARMKETFFKRSERMTLRLILGISQVNKELLGLKARDVDIKFTRSNTDNLLNKSNALSILHGTKIFDPVDAISLVGMTTAPDELMKKGEVYWKAHPEVNAKAPSPLSPEDIQSKVDDPANTQKTDRN